MCSASLSPHSDSYQELLSRHGKSFRWAQLFLRKREAQDSALAYAFCRLLDDAVDEATSPQVAQERLLHYQQMLLGEQPRSPLVQDYIELSERCGFGLEPALDLILGMQSDLHHTPLETDADLQTYCYRVAGTVGLMMSGILGVRSAAASQHAVDLGMGMQLTNICRDVREDAERGRVYIPQSRLAEVGLSAQDLLTPHKLERSPQLRQRLSQAVNRLLCDAEGYYASGEQGFRYLPTRARLAIAVAAYLYRGIGRRLQRVQQSDPWSGRVYVPFCEKLSLTALASQAWLSTQWTYRTIE